MTVANPIFFIFGAFFSSVVCGADRRPGRDSRRTTSVSIRLI
jgi:hypothetical protein